MMGEVIRVSGRTPDVGEFLREAMLTQRFADVALCCPGGQRFLAHRLVLSAASPYLQEVLLAHSKTSAHCEPITVILAEVEAPELAAILGFVYTGSATVPRPRLNAFLRAADALRIRLPPVPVAMTCAQPDCKQEDFKDVKINPKYLRCDQYPSCDEWFRGGNLRDDPGSKKEIYPIESRELGTFPETVNFGYNPAGSLYSNWSTTVFQSSQDTQTQRIEQWEKSRGNYPVPITRIDEADLTEKSVEGTLIPSCYDQEISRNPLDVQRRLDPLELRLRAGNYDQTYSKLPEEQFLDRSAENGVNGAIRSREGVPQNKSMGLQYIGRTRSYEKVDSGEDLSCREVCCRWRTPRRHVANRVTASPWRQIVRPHHSPKLQPLFLQTRVEETEVGEIARVPETAPLSISTSPNRQSPKSTTTTEVLYTLEVPNNPEVTINGNSRTLEACGNSETRLREYFSPQIPFATSRAPSISTTNNETQYFQSQSNVTPPTRPALSNVENAALLTVNRKSTNYFSGQIPRTPQKPEISHPVSRLCDTIESTEKSENFSILETQKVEEETTPDEKITRRIFVNSDSNNNDAIVTAEVPQRGRTIGPEDHKCDQCGKTFVTRASLKVHSRTHSGEKPFRCADCGKQFSQLRNYKYHRSVHEGTREFAATCPECGKYFNDRGYLSSHMKIHRNRKEYGCAECGKSFNQRVAYNMHVRIHTGVKPHQCEQCGKAFSRKMLLKQHLRTHSGERPYQCQVCQKAFADRSNMTLHTRLHSGLKPYQCTLCSKAFTKKHHLKTHLNYHTGTKPYSCPNCGLRFSQSSNMRTHFKKCTVNNPGGTKNSQSPNEVHPSKASESSVISRTPTDALTPPNSDQESSILTPISKTAVIEANMT